MEFRDDDLVQFDGRGALALPPGHATHVAHDGARLWYAAYGDGPPVFLLHGGLGNAGNWGYQVPALVAAGYRAIVVDTRGHGRSTRDGRPFSYQLLASDVAAVMDALVIDRAVLVGWSDGACTSLILADHRPARVAGVFFFACNMDPSGTLPFRMTPVIERCFSRHRKDHAALSATPERFQDLVDAVTLMQQTEPSYAASDLTRIGVRVTVALGAHDEFIRPEHADYMAASLPCGERMTMPGVSHFAPLQHPALFNAALLTFLTRVDW